MRALQAVDDAAHGVRRFDRERLGVAPRGDEGEHHHVGVAVEEDVFHELLGTEAGEVTARPGLVGETARRFGRPLESIGRRGLEPRAARVDEVALHVEDEFAFAAGRACASCKSSDASAGRSKMPPVRPAAALAVLKASSVLAAPHAETRNSAARQAQALRVAACRFVREAVCFAVRRRERHRQELAVGCSIELDGKAGAFRIDSLFHKVAS